MQNKSFINHRVLWLLIPLLTLFNLSTWGTTVTWTASSGALGSNTVTTSVNASGTIYTGSFAWSYTRSYASRESNKSDYVAWQSTNGYIQLGSGNFRENVTFTTSAITGTIESVSVNCASASGNHTLTIDVGGTKYRNAVSTPTWSSNNGSTITGPASGTGSSSGTITITLSAGTGAVYIKSISVTYSSCSGATLGTPVVTASPSSNRVDLSWPAVANASSYQLKWNGGDWTSATSPVSKTGLTNGTSYTYQVKAIGNGSTYCDGDPSEEASAIPGTYYTVTFMCNGSTYATKSIRSGQHLELPDNPSPCMAGKEFVGWATAAINGSTNTKPTFASTFTTISSNKTYYAVFATKTANSYSLGDANDLIEGQKVLIVNQNAKYAMANTGDDNGSLDATSVTISSSKISSPGSSLVWTVELDGAKYKFKNTHYIYDGGGSGSSYNTNLWCDDEDVDYPDSWTISSAGSTGKYYLNSDRSIGRKLEYWSSTFTTYASGTTEAFKHSFFVPTYTGYITTCCTPLGTINGSIY